MASTCDDLVGVPFQVGGRSRDGGFDCWGLAREVFSRYGIALPEWVADAVTERRSGRWQEVDLSATPPLAVLMSMRPPWVDHVAVYIGDGQIVHALKGVGVCIEPLARWSHRLTGVFRYVDAG